MFSKIRVHFRHGFSYILVMLQIYLEVLNTTEEKDCFLLIYETYRDLMFYVAQKFLSSQVDREIVVDAALHSIVDIIFKIKDPLSTKTKNLVVLITKNKCLDLLRKRGGVTEVELIEASERALPVPVPGTDELADAIASLRDPSRDIIFLRYLHGYSTAEISKILGISRDAAAKRLQRAKQDLKKLLDEDMDI